MTSTPRQRRRFLRVAASSNMLDNLAAKLSGYADRLEAANLASVRAAAYRYALAVQQQMQSTAQ